MEELTALAGVGRKTANVVLGNAFGINDGVVVDTHVQRLSTRLGLTKQTDPVKIEQDLMKLVPRDQTGRSSPTGSSGTDAAAASPASRTAPAAKSAPSAPAPSRSKACQAP